MADVKGTGPGGRGERRGGAVPAGEFVFAAEEAGSIRQIDRWVMRRAIEVAAAGRPVDLNFSVRSADDELLCGIALDGFVRGGRGSALLKDLPINVKLGTRFVNGLAEDGRRRRKARNAVAKAHASGQRVIAQGVEDLITLQLLPDLAIDEARGYALGRPEPIGSLINGRT